MLLRLWLKRSIVTSKGSCSDSESTSTRAPAARCCPESVPAVVGEPPARTGQRRVNNVELRAPLPRDRR